MLCSMCTPGCGCVCTEVILVLGFGLGLVVAMLLVLLCGNKTRGRGRVRRERPLITQPNYMKESPLFFLLTGVVLDLITIDISVDIVL